MTVEPTPALPSLEAARARRAELRASMLALEQALARPAPEGDPAWFDRVRACLDGLADDLRDHVTVTEGPDGLYRDVLAAAPRLAGAVRRLESEHPTLLVGVDAVCVLLDKAPERDVGAVREAANTLLAGLVRHRQRGADLVWEAFESDIGGET